jgi:hypothetical protein
MSTLCILCTLYYYSFSRAVSQALLSHRQERRCPRKTGSAQLPGGRGDGLRLC